MNIDEMKDRIARAEEIQRYTENRCEALEKENAELKSENQKWKDEWQEQVQKATDEGYARTLQTIQLTKAKVVLRNVIDYLGQFCSDYPDCVIEAELFLKDSEVEI